MRRRRPSPLPRQLVLSFAPASHHSLCHSPCRMAKYPLVAASDCTVDMKQEAVDICVTACERHPADMDKCTQAIKEALDRRYGGPWCVVVGKAFAHAITHEVSKEKSGLQQAGRRRGAVPWELLCVLPHLPPPTTLHPPPPPPPPQCKHFLHLFVGGTTGVLVWKL